MRKFGVSFKLYDDREKTVRGGFYWIFGDNPKEVTKKLEKKIKEEMPKTRLEIKGVRECTREMRDDPASWDDIKEWDSY